MSNAQKFLVLIAAIGVAAAIALGFVSENKQTNGQPAGRAVYSRHDLSDKRNVIVLVIDALRWDFLQSYSTRWAIDPDPTPNIDRLAQEGLRYKYAYSSGNWTRPSVASLLTGIQPNQHFDWFGNAGLFEKSDESGRMRAHTLDTEFMTISESLQSIGYSTVLIAPGPHGQYNVKSGFWQGFDYYITDYSDTRFTRTGKSLQELTDWIEFDAPGDRPFFAFVHTLGAHEPYDPPPPLDTIYAGQFEDYRDDIPSDGENKRYLVDGITDRSRYLELYAGLVKDLDNAIGDFFGQLQDLAVLENTLIVLTADHGHALWDHGRPGHGKTLYEEVVRVPLIIAGPDITPGVIDKPVTSVDLFPTIAAYAGAPVPEDGFHRGCDLMSSQLSERSQIYTSNTPGFVALVTDDRMKLVYNSSRSGTSQVELYDLSEDPLETVDLAAARPTQVREMFIPIREYLATSGGWHVEVIPRTTTRISITASSPLYGPVFYSCVEQGINVDCPVWSKTDTGVTGSARAGQITHINFRPDTRLAEIELTFDKEIAASFGGEIRQGQSFIATANNVGSSPESSQGAELDATVWRVPYPPAPSAELDDETIKRLRALGYIQ